MSERAVPVPARHDPLGEFLRDSPGLAVAFVVALVAGWMLDLVAAGAWLAAVAVAALLAEPWQHTREQTPPLSLRRLGVVAALALAIAAGVALIPNTGWARRLDARLRGAHVVHIHHHPPRVVDACAALELSCLRTGAALSGEGLARVVGIGIPLAVAIAAGIVGFRQRERRQSKAQQDRDADSDHPPPGPRGDRHDLSPVAPGGMPGEDPPQKEH